MGARAGFQRRGRARALPYCSRLSGTGLQRVLATPGHRSGPFDMRWTPDREFLYLRYGIATYAIPLRPGELRPPIPASGFPSKEGVAALPGGRLVADRDVYPGPNPSIHAFVEGSAQRNIYRVPLQ